MEWLLAWTVAIALAENPDMGAMELGATATELSQPDERHRLAASPEIQPTAPQGPPVTTASGYAELQLAQHLNQVGAKMYGAHWCPHCHTQKQLFGKTAAQQLNYIECAIPNTSEQAKACTLAEIRAYPTWEINGQLYLGIQPLSKLAELSNYTGPNNFLHPSE